MADQSYGKTCLMKALLHLKDGRNQTVELLLDISERQGDIKEFVNAAYTSVYYKGKGISFIVELRKTKHFSPCFWRSHFNCCVTDRPDCSSHSH